MKPTQKIEQILKDYDFNNTDAYYGYIVDSYINGQKRQCKELFYTLPGTNRKEFKEYLKMMGEEIRLNILNLLA